jgi:hypothetical protein
MRTSTSCWQCHLHEDESDLCPQHVTACTNPVGYCYTVAVASLLQAPMRMPSSADPPYPRQLNQPPALAQTLVAGHQQE